MKLVWDEDGVISRGGCSRRDIGRIIGGFGVKLDMREEWREP